MMLLGCELKEHIDLVLNPSDPLFVVYCQVPVSVSVFEQSKVQVTSGLHPATTGSAPRVTDIVLATLSVVTEKIEAVQVTGLLQTSVHP